MGFWENLWGSSSGQAATPSLASALTGSSGATDFSGLPASFLAQALAPEESYLAKSPWYNAARAVASYEMPAPTNNRDAILMPLLQGLTSGGLAGFGKNQAEQEQYTDIRKLLGASAAGYETENAPDDFSPSAARMGFLAQALSGEAGRKQKEALDLFKAKELIKEGVDPTTGTTIPGLEGRTSTADITGWYDAIPSADKVKISQAASASDALTKLANDFREANLTAPEFQLEKKFSASDANSLYTRMIRLVPIVTRLTGEVGNLAQQEQARQIEATLGNWTSGTEGVAGRIEELVDLVRDVTRGKLEGYKQAASDPNLLIEQLKGASASAVPTTPNEPAPAGFEYTGRRNANGDWGIRRIK